MHVSRLFREQNGLVVDMELAVYRQGVVRVWITAVRKPSEMSV